MFESNLKALRRKNNMRLAEVAAQTGGACPESMLSRYECGKSILSSKHAEALAPVYKVKAESLQKNQLLEMLSDVCQKSGAPAMLEAIHAMLENNSIGQKLRIEVGKSALKAVERAYNTPDFSTPGS